MRHSPTLPLSLPLSLLLSAAAVAAAGAASCYRSSPAPVDGRAAPTAPAGPAPRLTIEATASPTFDTSGLPAVSADGAAVLFGIQNHDGGRGNPNYRFELRSRGDAKIAAHTVLTVDEADSMYGADGVSAELEQRVAAANRWLAEQHAARRFVPLTKLEALPGEQIASSFRATGGGVTVEWRQNRLTIAQGGKPILERATPTSWLAKPRTVSGGDLTCENPAFLDGAAVSLEHKLALIVVGYGGTDTCWEPEDQHHVVAW
jgi:hypothetical protein